MKKDKIFTLIIFITFILFRFYISSFLQIANVNSGPILLFELLGKPLVVPLEIIMFSDFLNMILIGIIGKRIFSKSVGFIASLIYSISPWSAYLSLSGSVYVLVLLFLLLAFLGIQLIKEKPNLGFLLFVTAIVGSFITNLTVFFLLPFIVLLILNQDISKKIRKVLIGIVLFSVIPILILAINNPSGAKNISRNYVGIFNDIGLINFVNEFQGVSRRAGFGFEGRIMENKYTYLGRHLIFSFLKQFSPATYFTNQENLLGFSFNPPLYLGLLFPFLLGLDYLFNYLKRLKCWEILLILGFTVPSMFSAKTPDLARLFILSPFLYIFSSLGFVWGSSQKSTNIKKLLIFFSVLVVIFQIAVVLADIYYREQYRFMAFNK